MRVSRSGPKTCPTGHDQRRSRLPQHPRLPGSPPPAVDDHPERLPFEGRARPVPGRQPRVVRKHRVDPDHHRVRRRPQPVSVGPRLLARDPLRRPRPRGDLAIQAHGELRRYEGRPGRNVLRVRLYQPRRLPGHLARRDRYPSLREPRHAAAIHARVRIEHRRVDLHDARLDDRLGARPRPALVVARLERRVERRAPRPRPRLPDGHDLRVSLPRRPGVPLAHHLPVPHEHRPHGRIRTHRAHGLPSQRERKPHKRHVKRTCPSENRLGW